MDQPFQQNSPELESAALSGDPKYLKTMPIRLAIIVSHPIQYFAPWFRELDRVPDIDLKVFFCCDWGLKEYVDPGFRTKMAWDIPLLEGYDHEFLSAARRFGSL